MFAWQFAKAQYHSFNLHPMPSEESSSSENVDYLSLLIDQPLPLGSYEHYEEVYTQFLWERAFYYGGAVLEFAGPIKEGLGSPVKIFKMAKKIPTYGGRARQMLQLLATMKTQRISHFSKWLDIMGKKGLGVIGLSEFLALANQDLSPYLLYAYILDSYGIDGLMQFRMKEWISSGLQGKAQVLSQEDWEKIKTVSDADELTNDQKLQSYIDNLHSQPSTFYNKDVESDPLNYLIISKEYR